MKIRQICAIYLLLFFSVVHCAHTTAVKKKQPARPAPFKLGIENSSGRFLDNLQRAKKSPLHIGLITNHTAKNQKGVHTLDVLRNNGFKIQKIFAPEHGFDGSVAAEKSVQDSVHRTMQIPIVSLYGHGTGKKMAVDLLENLDVLVFDMQDAGMRHYTYIATLLHALKAAAQHDKTIVVFDRPNPLGGCMHGPLTNEHITSQSFISSCPIPLRHGMTIGELACYFNNHVLEKKAHLYVVPMQNYSRSIESPFFFAPLSPNIPTKNACHNYSFLGLLGEVRPLDIGLGTDKAMEYIGLPETIRISPASWQVLRSKLHDLGLAGKVARYYSNRKKQFCRGLHITAADISKVCSLDVIITVLQFFQTKGIQLSFSNNFDVAVGSQMLQNHIKGSVSREHLCKEIHRNMSVFFAQAKSCFLYSPLPEIVVLR